MLATISSLKKYDVVIGPALDGGFYLIATNKILDRNIFNAIPWSSPNTLEVLSKNLKKLNIRYKLLDPLSDIDTEEDLKAWDHPSVSLLSASH